MTLDEIKAAIAPLTTTQQVRVAIRAVQAVGGGAAVWDAWAEGWLSGADRSEEAARTAARAAARAAARTAAWAAAWAEAWAAAWYSTWAIEYAISAAPDLDLTALIAQAIEEEPA